MENRQTLKEKVERTHITWKATTNQNASKQSWVNSGPSNNNNYIKKKIIDNKMITMILNNLSPSPSFKEFKLSREAGNRSNKGTESPGDAP